jgi:hypothetical protein
VKVRELEELYGARIFFAGDLPADAGMVHLPGVVLHIGPGMHALKVRGDSNPLLGQGQLLGQIDKVTEARWILSVDPKGMAPSLSWQEVLEHQGGASSKFEAMDKSLRRDIEAFLAGKSEVSRGQLESRVSAAIRECFSVSEREYPPGAYIKWRYDYATRESGGIVTTFDSDPGEMARVYVKDLVALRERHGSRMPIANPSIDKELSESKSIIANSVIARPQDILVQQKLPLRETKLGRMMEFRVDVFDGHVVNTTVRSGFEYYPDEAAAAREKVRSFMEKNEGRYRYFTGGFDVALLDDGAAKPSPKSARIIETNPGSRSLNIDPTGSPVDANKALANFLGRPTPVLSEFEFAYEQGTEAQISLLKDFPGSPKNINIFSAMPAYEGLIWLRDRTMEDWRRKPTRESG